MKLRAVVFPVALCLVATVACFAADLNVGTWKLNEAKSKVGPGTPKINTIVYTEEGDQYKCVIDGVDASGNPTHNEWTGKFDGKDYPVTGDPNADMRNIKKVDAHHYTGSNKKDGKTTLTTTVSYSPDGKTRTLTVNATDPAGKKVSSTYVFDRQ